MKRLVVIFVCIIAVIITGTVLFIFSGNTTAEDTPENVVEEDVIIIEGLKMLRAGALLEREMESPFTDGEIITLKYQYTLLDGDEAKDVYCDADKNEYHFGVSSEISTYSNKEWFENNIVYQKRTKDNTSLPVLTKEEILEIADDFVYKNMRYPNKMKRTILSNDDSLEIYMVAYDQCTSNDIFVRNGSFVAINKYGEITYCSIRETDRYDGIEVEIDVDKVKECIAKQTEKNIISYSSSNNGVIYYKGDILYYGVSLYYKCLETENGVEKEEEYHLDLTAKASEVMKNWKD